MIHHLPLPCWLTLALSFHLSLSAATPPPEKLLPADTLGFVTAPNWNTAMAAWKQNALGQLWADPSMRAFRDKFQARFKADVLDPLEKELGLNPTNVANLFHGQITFAVTAGTPEKASFLFVADSGTNSQILATNLAELRRRWTEAGKVVQSAKIRDLDFTTLVVQSDAVSGVFDKFLPNPDGPSAQAKPPGKKSEWTLGQSGSLLIVSESPKEIERLLVLQAGGTLPALAEQAAFAGDAAQFRDSQALAWINLKAIFNRLPKSSGEGGDAEVVPMIRLLGALGLSSVQTLAVNLQESAIGTYMKLRVKAPSAERKGLLKIFQLEAKDSSPPPFIPLEVVKFNRLRLDLPKTWSTIESTVEEVSPQAASVIKLILSTAGKAEDPNFDLRESLLNRLGDDLLTFEKFPRSNSSKDYESPPSLMLFGARNAEAMAASMKAIANLMPPQANKYKEREFLGRTVYSFAWPGSIGGGEAGPAKVLHYAASSGYLALSTDVALLEEFLRSNNGATRPLRDKPGLAEAAQRVGGMSTGFFGTANVAESARAFFDATRKETFNAAALLAQSTLANRLGMNRDGGVLSWFDFAALPPYERVAKYFHFDVSSINLAADGYTYQFFAPAPPALKK